MRIAPVDLGQSIGSLTKIGSGSDNTASVRPENGIDSFKDVVKKAVSEVNSLQNQGDQMAMKIAKGDTEDVHQAMMAMNKAKLALDLTIQVRSKVVEAYQEIMRMQV